MFMLRYKLWMCTTVDEVSNLFPWFNYHYSFASCLFQIIPLSSHSSPDKAVNVSDCGEYGVPNASACSSMIWEFQSNTSDVPETYIGSACTSYLLSWQNCAVGPTDSGIILINATIDQAENEQLAIDTINILG